MNENKNTREETVILSDDPRFIKHIKDTVESLRMRRLCDVPPPGFRLCRSAFDRLEEIGLTDPKKLAEEYGLCLRRMSVRPAAIRAAVMEIGGTALYKHAQELAREAEAEAKEGEK